MPLLSQPIFKVNKLIGKNKIGQIYVFFGNNLDYWYKFEPNIWVSSAKIDLNSKYLKSNWKQIFKRHANIMEWRLSKINPKNISVKWRPMNKFQRYSIK